MGMPELEIHSMIGAEGFARLVAAFYRQVPQDDLLGPMYPASDLPGAEQRLRDFLIGRFGGNLRDRRIRVNVLSPGHIDTPILEDLQQGDKLVKMKKEMERNVPLGRLGDPDEIAKAVSFLASDEASYVSGAELYVDGGVAQI
jgi:hypothetical protein